MVIFSYSKLELFKKCRYAYKLKYIYKIKSEIKQTIESYLGNTVHKTLEWLYKNISKDFAPTLENTIKVYKKFWGLDFSEDILIKEKESFPKDYLEKGIILIANYYNKNYPFGTKTIETEKRIWINLEDDFPHKLVGYIDRLDYNFETNEYEIHDYKTSKNLPSQKTLDKDIQLALYSIGIKQLFGEEKVVSLIWHYLKHNEKIKSKRTKKELEELRASTIDLIKKINSNLDWRTSKTKLCDWCEYKIYCKAHGNSLPLDIKEKDSQQKLF